MPSVTDAVMMITDADALAVCLRGTPLEGRELTTYRLDETGEVLFSVDVGEEELVPTWSAARDVVSRTGRWPFAGNSIPREPLIELDAIDPDIRAVNKRILPPDWSGLS